MTEYTEEEAEVLAIKFWVQGIYHLYAAGWLPEDEAQKVIIKQLEKEQQAAGQKIFDSFKAGKEEYIKMWED